MMDRTTLLRAIEYNKQEIYSVKDQLKQVNKEAQGVTIPAALAPGAFAESRYFYNLYCNRIKK